jgi:hypothetical protein
VFYDVNVSRITTATKTVRVEADNREAAEERAVAQAHDEDFTGCVVEYDFEVGGVLEATDQDTSRTGEETGHVGQQDN